MKLTINDLKKYLDFDLPIQKIAECFVKLGFDVESIVDDVLDLEITPNRGDAMSVIGLARDLSAMLNKPLISKKYNINRGDYKILNEYVNINNEVKNSIWRYAGVIIKIKSNPKSPIDWQSQLEKIGQKPISTVVDATNIIMHELGQPLHGFDLDKLKFNKINLCLSTKGDTITTLDGQTRSLPEGVLIAKDGDRLIDLVGIQGGEDCSIDNSSKNILIQSAIFDPKVIRRSMKLTGHRTDASARYERGVDWEQCVIALTDCVEMILSNCEGYVVQWFDLENYNQTQKTINLDIRKINHILGVNLDGKLIKGILTRLGFEISDNSLTVPSWRNADINIIEDIAEEVARIYGYENISVSNLENSKSVDTKSTYHLTEILKNYFVSLGFTEVQTSSFISLSEGNILPEKLVNIENPISNLNQFLRPKLIYNMLKVLSRNNWYGGAAIFEIGHTFEDNEEKINCCLAWEGKQSKFNHLSDKNIIQINPSSEIAKFNNIKTNINYIELQIDHWIKLIKNEKPHDFKLIDNSIKAISKFPPAIRDISFTINREVDDLKVTDSIFASNNNILLAEIFDSYVSEKIGNNKKSLSYHLVIDNDKLTPTQELIDKVLIDVTDQLASKFNVNFR